jgi:hypothetical protein
MKKLMLPFLVALVLVVTFTKNANAQTEPEWDNITITLTSKNVSYTLTGGDVFMVTTPSGNFIRTLTFVIDESHPMYLLPNPWAYFFSAKYQVTINGEKVTLIGMAVVTHGGVVKLRYISNGSGNIFSPGRF